MPSKDRGLPPLVGEIQIVVSLDYLLSEAPTDAPPHRVVAGATQSQNLV